MDSGIVTPVAELSPTHWDCTDAVPFTSVAPYLDVAFETDEENTLICHQCGADHIAPFDVAFPFLNGDATFYCKYLRARGCISHLRPRARLAFVA